MAAQSESYLLIAERYSAGVRALFSADVAPAQVERGGMVSFATTGLVEQGSQLAPISEQFTQTTANLLSDPDPQVRADASAQMLAKALVDLQVSAYLLQAADYEQPSASGERSFGVERSAAVSTVEEALAVILAEPGRAALLAERGFSAPTHIPAARKQVSQMTGDILSQIETRAGKTAQSTLGGLFTLGISQVTQAAGIVGMDIAQAIGIGDKVSQAMTLVREFFINAYNTIAALLGPALTSAATTQVVAWVHGAVQGQQFITAVSKIYDTQKTQTELRTLVDGSDAGLDKYIGALQGLEQLDKQYLKQMGIVDKITKVLRFAPSIPLAAMPQGRLLLAACYILLTGYVVFAGADYVDAPRFRKLDRIPGPRKIINKNLSPDPDDDSDNGGPGPDDGPPPAEPTGGQKAEPPESAPEETPPPQEEVPAESAPPVETVDEVDEFSETVDELPEVDASEPVSGAEPPGMEEAGVSPDESWYEPSAGEFPPGGGISFGGLPVEPPSKEVGGPPAPSPPPPAAREEPPRQVIPEDDLIEERIRLDVAAPSTPAVVGEAFEIAVAIRQPQSDSLEVDGLDRVTSADGFIFRHEAREIVRYRVKVSAPNCQIETKEQSFLLRAGRESEARFFQIIPKKAGDLSIIVTAYQEDELVVAQTRVRVVVTIKAVNPTGPSPEAVREMLLKELAAKGVVIAKTNAIRAGSFTFKNLDVELFDYQVDDNENERFRVRVECALAGEQSIADADIVEVPGGLRRSLGLLKRRGLQQQEIVDLGKQIGQMLFPPTARWYYDQSRARLREDEALRIRIKTDDYPLANIAWEFAFLNPRDAAPDYNGPDGFLVLDRRVSLVRYEVLGQPVSSLDPLDHQRLVMLLMLANSSEPQFPKLDLSREKKNIVKALEKTSLIDLRSFSNVTYSSLQDTLEERAHIFHFAGHGVFHGDLGPLRSTVGEGYLLLKGKTPKESLFSASKLALNLRGSGVRLAVLGVCEGGERDPVNAWTGIAPALARAGIPAVVAMQFKVYDHAAIAFHRSFYRALAAGEPVDTAVANGRRAVYNLPDGDRDWGTPVLYLRADDGVLFPRPSEIPPADISFTPGILPERPTAPDPHQLQLYEALSGYAFSIDDLEDLCFRLGVDWDILEGQTKPAKARAMVQFFVKKNDLNRLYQIVKTERPALELP